MLRASLIYGDFQSLDDFPNPAQASVYRLSLPSSLSLSFEKLSIASFLLLTTRIRYRVFSLLLLPLFYQQSYHYFTFDWIGRNTRIMKNAFVASVLLASAAPVTAKALWTSPDGSCGPNTSFTCKQSFYGQFTHACVY